MCFAGGLFFRRISVRTLVPFDMGWYVSMRQPRIPKLWGLPLCPYSLTYCYNIRINSSRFTSKDRNLLVKAFITYVRPILEYNSSVWSPTSKNEVRRIEAVQRRFIKRITGMSNLSYYSRLNVVRLAVHGTLVLRLK